MKPAVGRPADFTDFILERRYRLARPMLPARRGALLDFGCGNGAQTLCFRDDFDLIYGADVTRSSLDAFAASASALGCAGKVRLHHLETTELSLPDASIDCATSFEVLEHVPDERRALGELRRVLRPDGALVISVPNKWWIFETHGADLPLLPWNRVPLLSWLPTPLHERWARARIYTRGRIVGLLESSGFAVDEALYVTAPMDVVSWGPLRRLLRATLFRGDAAPAPVLATSILVRARPS